MTPVTVQLGLFGAGEVAGFHVVSAHFRVARDGAEVFVGEHLRNNRGRSAPRSSPPALRPLAPPAAPPPGQLPLLPVPAARPPALPAVAGQPELPWGAGHSGATASG